MKPLVSIGMTVYNAQPFLRETLDSLLAQDYPNFELIISDNASTDGSSEICQEYARRDSRIRYYRNSENVGAVKNWNLALSYSRGEYFMWAADHDLWQPEYIRQAVEILESDSETVLVYSPAIKINSDGLPKGEYWDNLYATSNDAACRYLNVLMHAKYCTAFHSVIRTKALHKINGVKLVWSFDHLLLAELSIIGKLHINNNTLLSMRINHELNISSDTHYLEIYKKLSPHSSNIPITRKESLTVLRNKHIYTIRLSNFPLPTKIILYISTYIHFNNRYGIGITLTKLLRLFSPKHARRYVRYTRIHI